MRTVGALLATLSCTAFAEAAHADTRDAHEPLVILTEQGSKDAENIAFFSSVRALAAEIGILVTTEEVPSFQNVRDTLVSEARVRKKPFLVAWIQREERVRTVHLFDPWNNKLRTRIIDVGDSATANAEALALILRAELVAYLHDLTPPPPPLSPPVPAPAPPPSSPEPGSRWALAAFYTLGNFLRGHGAQQGVRIAVEPMEQHFRLGIGYTLLPEETAGQEVAIIVRRHPIDLDLGYASREHHRLRWVGGTVLSGDWVTRHTSLAPSPLSSEPDSGHFVVSAGLRVRQELRILRNLVLGLAVRLDIPLNPIEFQTSSANTTKTVARLAPVRFIAELGIKALAF